MTMLDLIDEWAYKDVRSIALGGGEPMAYSHIFEIVEYAKKRGLFVSITTNGSYHNLFSSGCQPDRVHISFDEMHEPEFAKSATRDSRWIDLQGVLDFYKGQGSKVGINHIVTDMKYLLDLDDNIKMDNLLLLLEKPKSTFRDWEWLFNFVSAKPEGFVWLDACLMKYMKGIPCKQGITSFSLDYNLMASRCSNVKEKFLYSTLDQVWARIVQSRECLYR